ncbi:MAG: hypothetical protein CMF96_05170 [Candidatus Marinimicrobia bacterium]|nr:hypothetical protein [Candidatus Neomarinimicrobiota bacterium]|tara:strand:- start:442 stop:1107 length:666 start_codon:yes stop_codon:yes gene_type:complete
MSKDKELYQDPIREKLIGFIENAYEQKNSILNIVIAIIIIISGFSFFNYSNTSKNDEANSAFGVAQNSYINGLQDFALIELKKIAEDYPDESAGNLAKLFLAAESFKNGNFEDADSELLEISGKFEVNALNSNIKSMRADIALSKGNYDEALNLYEDAKKTCEISSYKIKYEIGRLFALQAKGEHEMVVQLANILLDDSEITNLSKNNLEELRAYSKHFSM